MTIYQDHGTVNRPPQSLFLEAEEARAASMARADRARIWAALFPTQPTVISGLTLSATGVGLGVRLSTGEGFDGNGFPIAVPSVTPVSAASFPPLTQEGYDPVRTLAVADPTHPRIDLIYVRSYVGLDATRDLLTDYALVPIYNPATPSSPSYLPGPRSRVEYFMGESPDAAHALGVVQGTPAASPVAPALPDPTYLLKGYAYVGASATTLSFTGAAGGINFVGGVFDVSNLLGGIPRLDAPNTFTAPQTVTGLLTVDELIAGGGQFQVIEALDLPAGGLTARVVLTPDTTGAVRARLYYGDATGWLLNFTARTAAGLEFDRMILDDFGRLGLNTIPGAGFHALGAGMHAQALDVGAAGLPLLAVHNPGDNLGTYHYWVVALDASGNRTLPSTEATVTPANSVLDATHYVTISWNPVPGARSYDVLKGDTGHKLVSTSALTYDDHGAATTVYTTPTRNETADITGDGELFIAGEAFFGADVVATGTMHAALFKITTAAWGLYDSGETWGATRDNGAAASGRFGSIICLGDYTTTPAAYDGHGVDDVGYGFFLNDVYAAQFRGGGGHLTGVTAAGVAAADVAAGSLGAGVMLTSDIPNTQVTGLGTASTHDATDFDASGAAASVNSDLVTHEGLTGASVHGLGTASTHAATDFAASNATTTVGTTSVALGRAPAAQLLTGVSIDGNAASATAANTAQVAGAFAGYDGTHLKNLEHTLSLLSGNSTTFNLTSIDPTASMWVGHVGIIAQTDGNTWSVNSPSPTTGGSNRVNVTCGNGTPTDLTITNLSGFDGSIRLTFFYLTSPP